MPIYEINSSEAEAALRAVEQGRRAGFDRALAVADEAIAGVRARGDAFVAQQIARFDGAALAPEEILVRLPWSAGGLAGDAGQPSSRRRRPTGEAAGPPLRSAVATAIERVESFHLEQLPRNYRWTRGGTEVLHRVRPLRRVGIYVPGGRAIYLSTLVMCAVPARIAGVRELVVATPPRAAGNPELRAACELLGVREIYRAGGPAAIAALALGTETLERVDKIVGPGNAYVTAAKLRLAADAGIDMIAGPTELVVVADETADAGAVVADLLAQAEHGDDSAVFCITTSRELAARIPDRAITIVTAALDEAIALADRIAPEHLSIQARDAEVLARRVENCAAIYCGSFSPPAAGDYVIGTNHVLPTAGSARFSSPLGVYDFVKRSNVITLTADGLATIAPDAERIARFEGLPRHAESVSRPRMGART